MIPILLPFSLPSPHRLKLLLRQLLLPQPTPLWQAVPLHRLRFRQHPCRLLPLRLLFRRPLPRRHRLHRLRPILLLTPLLLRRQLAARVLVLQLMVRPAGLPLLQVLRPPRLLLPLSRLKTLGPLLCLLTTRLLLLLRRVRARQPLRRAQVTWQTPVSQPPRWLPLQDYSQRV